MTPAHGESCGCGHDQEQKAREGRALEGGRTDFLTMNVFTVAESYGVDCLNLLQLYH